MLICPECEFQVEPDSKYCASCGLIFHRESPERIIGAQPPAEKLALLPQIENDAVQEAVAPPAGPAPPLPSKLRSRIVIAVIAGAVFLAAYYWPALENFAGRRNHNANSVVKIVENVAVDMPNFDVSIATVDRPSGLAWTDHQFVAGNMDAPGLLSLKKTDGGYVVRKRGGRNVHLLAWNGQEYIGYAKRGALNFVPLHRFSIHDAKSLETLRHVPAPDSIGGLAWDGSAYWAATANSETGQGFLYRLDRNFVAVNKMVAPSASCSGLAWDGSYLWFVDNFAAKLHVLNVKGIHAVPIRSFDIGTGVAANGIVFDGNHIWISDSAQKRLLRLKPTLNARRR